MNDIDFDELDRAVSSLIGKPKPSTAPSSTPNDAKAPAPSAPKPVETPPPAQQVAPKPRPPIAPLPAAPTGVQTPPAARRAGRFMDVVHPSRPTPGTPAKPAPSMPKPADIPQPTRISYTGKKLEPIPGAPKPHLDLTPQPKPVTKPDEDEPLLTAEVSSHPEVKAKEQHDTSSDLSAPLFLSGTKVEKRPLGKFSAKNPEEEKQTSVDDLPQKGTTDLPPELDNKVVAVEAGDIEETETKDRPDTPPAYPPEPEAGKLREKEQSEPKPRTLPAHATTQSIPAQYKAKHSETDMTPRPIFDTKDYHQPLAHPVKKPARKPWMWIVFALSLLAIGAALGVGAYFLLG